MITENDKFRFGPLRSHATTKPRVNCPEPVFFRCECCGSVLAVLQGTVSEMSCCGCKMSRLETIVPDENERFDYTIFGGPNENAVKVSWLEDSRPEWIYLRTFTGGQLKYVEHNKKAPVLFALADEDAYAYCDKDPCAECRFRCKRGFELFFYIPGRGLLMLPLDRSTSHPRL